jgi:hypothetical protein
MVSARIAALLTLPICAVPVLVARVADEQAVRLGAGLATVSQLLSAAQRERAHERDSELVSDWRAELADLWDELSRAPIDRVEAALPAPRATTSGTKGLHVKAQTVLEIANRGARPGGIFVAAEGKRPAGLMLLGVSGLDVGLRDGDILTHAAGQPATSEGQVVSLVLSARGARQARIGGRIWRKGASFPLVVEQPYLSPTSQGAPTGERAKHESIAPSDGTG